MSTDKRRLELRSRVVIIGTRSPLLEADSLTGSVCKAGFNPAAVARPLADDWRLIR